MEKPAKKPAAKVKDLKPKKNPKGGRKAGGKQYDFWSLRVRSRQLTHGKLTPMKNPAKKAKPTARVKDLKPKKNPKGGVKANQKWWLPPI